MAPDTRLRLAAVKKGLEDIIAPLIPADADFANEQLGLILRSIEIVYEQIPHEEAFLIHDGKAFAALARDLLQEATEETPSLATLRAAIMEIDRLVPAVVTPRAELERAVHTLRLGVEQAVDELGRDPAMLAKVGPLVLDFTRRQTQLERRWVVATGFDPAPGDLPSLKTLLYPTAG